MVPELAALALLRLKSARTLRWTAALPAVAWAHHAPGAAAGIEPWAVVCLAGGLALYAVGIARLWKRAGRGRGISQVECARFAAGWIVLAAALLPPLDALSDRSFALHMVQHELLMVVAAPLFVLARPLEAWTWALAPTWRSALARLSRVGIVTRTWDAAVAPTGAFAIHAIALWAWHLPILFQLALDDTAVHALQHACFFASALCFWRSVLARESRAQDGAAMASLFATMLHTSALGALLTFAISPWYPAYAAVAGGRLTPLEDQQLGGLVMWVPGGMAYIVAALALAMRWLRREPAPSFR